MRERILAVIGTLWLTEKLEKSTAAKANCGCGCLCFLALWLTGVLILKACC